MSPRCRSCGAPILWALTDRGKRIPLDELPLAAIPPGSFVVSGTGDELRASTVAPVPLYRSHFATCPNADEHRRR
jgi:hypothetical protein